MSRHIWEDAIRINLSEIVAKCGNWTDSAQNRDYWRALAKAALNPGFYNSYKFTIVQNP